MADQGRHEDMYCHACHHQWRRQGNGMECPACGCMSTEIIDSQHDPRNFHNRQRTAVNSDPLPAPHISDTSSTSTVSSPPSQPGLEGANSSSTAQHTSGSTPQPAATRIQISPVTFVSFSVPLSSMPQGSQVPPPTHPEVFDTQIFPFVITFSRPPTTNTSSTNPTTHDQNNEQTNNQHSETQQSDAQAQQPLQPGIDAWFQHVPSLFFRLMSTGHLFNPANAIFGDAVYSQEALDRIISQLREQEAAGGAPPASQAAIDRLQTKELDDKMLGVCSKCVICVDDLLKGEKAAVLPCDHFFHGECVTPWLKQHNTCPVCRRSIEVERDEGKNVKTAGMSPSAPQSEARNGASDAMNCS
ncbi:uncharacterized protein B0T15DRAFT_418112 [Chaetomium strumarium]|uniref:RING-type E3 ubiquitin transferase n=1 Tax=Chaetomium strumarium TaxID=1170767 RepID=A0AAJ0M0A8_9PEZI|nr:hypothetical protein B0T15DRAFT_418112 [Chaetomium strumarium]